MNSVIYFDLLEKCGVAPRPLSLRSTPAWRIKPTELFVRNAGDPLATMLTLDIIPQVCLPTLSPTSPGTQMGFNWWRGQRPAIILRH